MESHTRKEDPKITPVVQQVKPTPAVHLLQLPAQVPGRAALNGPGACAPDGHVGDPGEAPDFSLAQP